MSSIATSPFMNGVVRGMVAMRTRGRSLTHTRYFVDDHHFRLRPAQRFRLFAREEHAHCAVGPFQPSPRGHPTRPRITAAGREYTALAFDVDIVKVGRGWGDEVNALYASAHRSMNRCRHRVRFAGAAAA